MGIWIHVSTGWHAVMVIVVSIHVFLLLTGSGMTLRVSRVVRPKLRHAEIPIVPIWHIWVVVRVKIRVLRLSRNLVLIISVIIPRVEVWVIILSVSNGRWIGFNILLVKLRHSILPAIAL
jgi:hypothetical protein